MQGYRILDFLSSISYFVDAEIKAKVYFVRKKLKRKKSQIVVRS